MSEEHILNPALFSYVQQVREKRAFIPGGDPSMTGGGGGAPPGGDPSQGGGAPPPGGDPSGGAGGGGGGDPLASLQPMIQQMVQQQMQQMGGGAGGAGGQPLKPKIDVNVEMMQIKNMLAKVIDHLGIQVPAQDMVATPDKLMAMSQGQSTATPGGGAGGAGGGAIGGMPPMDPMQGSGVPGGEKAGAYVGNGTAFDTSGFTAMSSKASAIVALRSRRK